MYYFEVQPKKASVVMNDSIRKLRKGDFHKARDFMEKAISSPHIELFDFFVNGKTVTAQSYLDAANKLCQEEQLQLNATTKVVWAKTGAAGFRKPIRIKNGS